MRELIDSMVRFSAAMTLFSLQQMQNAFTAAADTQAAMDKFSHGLNAVTDAIKKQLDENQQPALDSMTKLGSDLVNRTWSAVNAPALDPREMIKTTGDLMRKTTDSMTEWMRSKPESATGEPQPAAEALAGGKRR